MVKRPITNSFSAFYAIVLFAIGLGFAPVKASGGHGNQNTEWGTPAEEPADIIIHHVMDSHDWHITDFGETPIALHLPWLVYNSETGLQFFGSTEAMIEADEHYMVHHDHIYYVKDRNQPLYHGPEAGMPHHFEEEAGKYAIIHEKFEHKNDDGEKEITTVVSVFEKVEGATIIDFSMTKTALHMILISILMIFLFTRIAKAYKKREGMAPKGIQSFFEPVIVFVRDDIARPNLGDKAERFLPYLLSLFFFIWFSNLFGLMPLSSNITGNTTITIMLGLMTFILIIANAKKDFWMHILWFPGVPVPLKLLMFVVELMGFFTKPIALAIRLFANISAGHFMVLALISLIFILGKNGENPGGAYGIMPISIGFTIFIFLVELIVAAVQAFVFALLTAVFLAQAMESHDDHGHDHEHDEAHAHAHA